VFALATLRRASLSTAIIPGLLAIFCVLPMTHYYWAMLSLLPLSLPDESRMRSALLMLFAALAVTAAKDLFQGFAGFRFALMSVELMVFLLYCCIRIWRDDHPSALAIQ
jgi:hypothetical protein